MPTTPASPRKTRYWLWISAGILALSTLTAIVLFLCLMYLSDINVPTKPITLTRPPGGQFTYTQPNQGQLELDLIKLNAEQKTSNANANTSWSGNVKLQARSAVVLAESNSPLDRRVAYNIFKSLQSSPFLEEVSFFPAGTWSVQGQPLPHIIIRVNTLSFTESGPFFNKAYIAKVRVTTSDSSIARGTRVFDHLVTPMLIFDDSKTFECTANQKGIESASLRYQALAQQISTAASLHIDKLLGDLITKHGLAPAPDPIFLPAYTPTPNFPSLQKYNARLVSSGTAYMKSNVTNWDIPAQSQNAQLTADIIADLNALGWKVSTTSPSAWGSNHYYATSPDFAQTFEVFWPSGVTPPGTPRPCQITFTHRMADSEMNTAISAFLTQKPIEKDLIIYENLWSRYPKPFQAYFAQNPPRSLKGLHFLVDQLIAQKRLDDARKLLLRMDTLSRFDDPGTGVSQPILAKAQSQGIPTLPAFPDLSALAPQDVIDLTKDLPTSRTLQLDQSIILIIRNKPQDIKVIRLTPIRPENSNRQYTLKLSHVTFGKGTSSWGDRTEGDATGQYGPIKLDGTPGPVAVTCRFNSATRTFDLDFK